MQSESHFLHADENGNMSVSSASVSDIQDIETRLTAQENKNNFTSLRIYTTGRL